MHKTWVSLAFVLLVAASAASAQEAVKCESSDGKYRECMMDSFGRVVMTRQMSDTNCVEGKNWGYRDGVVWVDAGCRGEFAVSRGFLVADKLVVCESENNGRSTCKTDTSGGVAVMRQLSRNACVRGRSWGFDGDSIWVDEGCRAEFVIGMSHSVPVARLDQAVRCESVDGKPARCMADTSAGVHLVRQISDNNCRYGRHWGYDENGIWVREGCRAEFAVRGMPAQIATTLPASLVCESLNNTRKHCRTDTTRGVTLVRQLSDNLCARGRSWGVDEDGVWVNAGCRAEFMIGHATPAMTSSALAPSTLLCESIDGRRTHCAVDTSLGVRLFHQRSDSACVMGRTWGLDENGVWVSGGCRAEFATGR